MTEELITMSKATLKNLQDENHRLFEALYDAADIMRRSDYLYCLLNDVKKTTPFEMNEVLEMCEALIKEVE